MPKPGQYDFLILGRGESGKYLAWTMAKAGHRVAVMERRWIGGSCPNIACLPSKYVIYSAHVESLFRRGKGVRHRRGPGQRRHGRCPRAQAQDGR